LEKMNDYNLEFCHIYSGEKLNREHLSSIRRYKIFLNKNKNKKIVSVVLIDNYNSQKSFNINNFICSLRKLNICPDFLVFEKDIVNSAKNFIKKLPKKEIIKSSNAIYLRNKVPILLKKGNKYSCTFLISCWILARFGVFKLPIKKLTDSSFSAGGLVTILPRKYEMVELNAQKIISKTKYSYLLSNLDYIFF